MRDLTEYIKESLLDMDEDSPELQQSVLFEKILGYYKKYRGVDYSIVSNHRHTSFYLDDITDHKKYKDLIKDFDLFLKESNIHHKKNTDPHGFLYEFDFGLTISWLLTISWFTYNKHDIECRCLLHTSKNNGLKYFDNGLK